MAGWVYIWEILNICGDFFIGGRGWMCGLVGGMRARSPKPTAGGAGRWGDPPRLSA